MTKEEVLKMVEEHIQQAKALGDRTVEYTLKSGNTSSLGKIINTKEKADLFMKMLEVL